MNFTNMKDFMNRLTDWIIPGNSIVVYHKNKEVFRYSSGFSDVENKIPMTGDELLNIYSCSKVATVVAALQLYEKGIFLLDDPIYEYISEFKEMSVLDENGEIRKAKNPITFRHLFTHTSGLTYDIETENIKALYKTTNGRMPTVEVAKAIAKDPLAFEPGTCWCYSLSHDILAALVEVISGKRFSNYVTENIFEPIGIKDVYYHRTNEIYDKMAQQYRYEVNASDNLDLVKQQFSDLRDGGKIINEGKDAWLVFGSEYDSGGAGIVTTVSSYAKFADVLATGGKTLDGECILSKGTIDLLRTNQLTDATSGDFIGPDILGYGYGLGVRTMIDKAASGFNGQYGEFGWSGAAGATISIDPENQFSYFYAHHMLNPQQNYYQPRLRNVAYSCLFG